MAPRLRIDHLEAVASGMRNEDATRRWLKGAVVKRAVGSAGYFNYARKLQRHRSSPRRDAFLPQLTMSQASRL
jgi:hypothetical protein